MQNYKKTLSIAILFAISGCATSNTSLSPNSNYGHNNYKYFPYKSAIIKYERGSEDGSHKRVRVWDNWGVQSWNEEADIWSKNSRDNNVIKTRTILFLNNGTAFYANYRHKKIIKNRNINQDELLVANQDLSDYYVEREFAKALFDNSDFKKSGKSETIAGQKCNLWVSEEVRLCMYKDLIFLKSEVYSSRQNKWIIKEKAVSAQFNVAIDKSLFKLPNFPIEVDSRYVSDKEMYTMLKEQLSGESELVQRIKAKGKEIRDKMKKRE